MKKKVIFSSVIITLISNLYANNQLNNNFFNQGKEGYFFYKDEKIVDEKDKEKKIIKTETSSIKSEYSKTKEMMDMVFENDEERENRLKKENEFMDNIPFHKLDELSTDEYKRLLDVTRNISTGRPNKEFVKKYAAVQKFLVDKSENFAKSWSVANLENPDELLYTDIGWTSRDRVNLKNKKVLYIKALRTVSNLVKILKGNNILIDELVTYQTSCKKSNISLEDNSVFIFTSPSSVECFFNQYKWKDNYKAIVIGKTTAKYLPKEVHYTISSETSIDECINLAQQTLL